MPIRLRRSKLRGAVRAQKNQSQCDWFHLPAEGFCRDDWIRTSDHLHPMQVRYRTALRPESCFVGGKGKLFFEITKFKKQNLP
jgi:hypothetical protein